MDAIDMIVERRSVRKYKEEKVSHELLTEIVEIAKYAPSWANYQIARYTFIDNENKIKKIAEKGVKGFTYNVKTLENAKGVAILSYVKGKSGKFDPSSPEYITEKGNEWEMFDAGIACQTFCLAAHAKGVGTCIFGVIDDNIITEVAELPEEETVAAVIVYGYPDEKPEKTKRKDVEKLVRFN